MLDWNLILHDGGLLTVAFLTLVLAMTRYKPRLWLNPREVPADIYAAVPAQSPAEKRAFQWLNIPIFFILAFLPLWSTLRFAQLQPEAGFSLLFWHAFLVALLPTLGDLLIIDWLLLNTITPDFVVFSGTKGLPGYKDYGFHLRAHLRLLPMQVAGAATMAGLALLLS